jgi:hypothetical protein
MKSLPAIMLTFCVLALAANLFAASTIEARPHFRESPKKIQQELDPQNEQQCFSMGSMSIDYKNAEPGLPQLGFQITDPHGRRIAYDPQSNRASQEMPLAQAYLDCDENEETGETTNCKGHIEICGPISGTYRIELFTRHAGNYSLSVSAASGRAWSASGYDATTSHAQMRSDIDQQKSVVLLLHYSREIGTQVTLTDETRHLANK